MNEPALRQRLATILVADVAGYSRLMGCDESGTVAALDQRARGLSRERSKRHQGRVDRHGRRFGARGLRRRDRRGQLRARGAAHPGRRRGGLAEDCRMRFRIGVHLGDVMEKSDGTVYGDGVNIAARLEALAEPGGVCDLRARCCGRSSKRVDGELRGSRRAAASRTSPSRCASSASSPRPATGAPAPAPRTRRGRAAAAAGARPRRQAVDRRAAVHQHERRRRAGVLRRRHHRGHHHRAVALPRAVRDRAQLVLQVQGQGGRRAEVRARARRAVRRRGQRAQGRASACASRRS